MILYRRFLQQVERHRDKTAIVHRHQRLSYTEVARLVEGVMYWIAGTGSSNGIRVGLFLHNGPVFTVALLATAGLGAVVAPLPVAMGATGLHKALRRLKLTHIIGERTVLEKLAGMEHAPPPSRMLAAEKVLDMRENHRCGSPSPPAEDADAPWVLTMTSGSTGDPKPIVLSQRCKLDRATLGAQRIYDLSERDVILTASPMYHSLGMRLGLLPLLIGATSVILHKFAPLPWLRSVQEEGITFTVSISHQLPRLLPHTDRFRLDSLRCLVSSSALLSREDKLRCLESLGCSLHECYGTSETGIITDLALSDAPEAASSVGKALPHVVLKIVDEDGRECPTGEIGEIACRTRTAFSGYEGREPATTDDSFFRTGDLGCLDGQGYLYLKGRKKEIIKVGGVSVFPQDIESVVGTYPGVSECAAVGLRDTSLGERIAVALVLDHPDRFDLEGLRRFCIGQLADYQQPQDWYLLDTLPKNPLGKLQRTRLAEQLESRAE